VLGLLGACRLVEEVGAVEGGGVHEEEGRRGGARGGGGR
jgi:hypothetical protein